MNELCDHAFTSGLDREVLTDVVSIVSRKTELDQTSVTNLIKNLFPREEVAEAVVVTVVGGLGQGNFKPSLTTQALLLRWLFLVFPVLESRSILPRLYGVLFGFLDMMSIRYERRDVLSTPAHQGH